jgi:hypothetical protein
MITLDTVGGLTCNDGRMACRVIAGPQSLSKTEIWPLVGYGTKSAIHQVRTGPVGVSATWNSKYEKQLFL